MSVKSPPKRRRAFEYQHNDRLRPSSGERFTNIDRIAFEGEHMQAIRAAVRTLQLEKRAILRDIAAAEHKSIRNGKMVEKVEEPEEVPTTDKPPAAEPVENEGEAEPNAAT